MSFKYNPLSDSLDKVNSKASEIKTDNGQTVEQTFQNILNWKEDITNKSTNTNLWTSDTLYPTQNAVKTYIDNNVWKVGSKNVDEISIWDRKILSYDATNDIITYVSMPSSWWGNVIVDTNDPATNSNYSVWTLWVNTTTWELFVCIDDTTNNNVWQWQLWTTIKPVNPNWPDFFGDGSWVALYKLDGNINDAGGNYNWNLIWNKSDLIFTTDVAKPSFNQSLKIVWNQNQAFIIPQNTNLQIKSMSVWVKRLSTETPSNAYLIDSRNNWWNCVFIYNSNIIASGIAKYLVNWQAVSLDNSYKDQWIHLYIEFSSIQNWMVVGFYNWLSGNYDFGWYTDHIRLFNRALTDSEVQQLYNEWN